ncbi:MAG: response regulator [Candidatus Cloacimonetes bacterium]|nr:response regulator [Candidatus Cloacimonadota bacterium]
MPDKLDKARILLVDDVPANIKVAGNILRHEDYKVVFATSGREALERLGESRFDLVLLDIMMPEVDGFEVCRQLKLDETTRDIPVIFLTAKLDTESILKAYNIGGQDFVTKPFNESELLARIRAHLDLKRSHERLRTLNCELELEVGTRKKVEKKLRQAQAKVRKTNSELEKRVKQRTSELEKEIEDRKKAQEAQRQSYEKLNSIMDDIILTMARLVEIRDPYTAGHQQRVADLAVAIATKMNLSKDEIDGIRAAGIVHDIGKMYVPGELLTRPGKLEEFEFKVLQAHAAKGSYILRSIDFPWPVADMVGQHHERLDGSGYPEGLAGDEILQGARILAVADVVEAISSHRPYRAALGIDVALAEIRKNAGKHFEVAVVSVCCELFENNEFSFDRMS